MTYWSGPADPPPPTDPWVFEWLGISQSEDPPAILPGPWNYEEWRAMLAAHGWVTAYARGTVAASSQRSWIQRLIDKWRSSWTSN